MSLAGGRCQQNKVHQLLQSLQSQQITAKHVSLASLAIPCTQNVTDATTSLSTQLSVTTFEFSTAATVSLDTNPQTLLPYTWPAGQLHYFANLAAGAGFVTLTFNGGADSLTLAPGDTATLYQHAGSSWIVIEGASTGALSRVVWRPNYTGPAQQGVYADFLQAYAALGDPATRAPIDLWFDPIDSLPVPGVLTLPTGTFNMTNVRWSSAPFLIPGVFVPISVVIPEGTLVTHLRSINGMTVQYDGVSAPCEVINVASGDPDGAFAFLTNGGAISAGNVQPFWRIIDPSATGTPFIVGLISPASLESLGLAGAIDLQGASVAVVNAIGGSNASVADNAFSSDGTPGGGFLILYESGFSISRPFSALGNMPLVGAGSFISLIRNGASSQTMNQGVAPLATDDVNAGFVVGDLWVHAGPNDAYICVNDSPGAAIWNLL